MLDQNWEAYAISLANCESASQMVDCINNIVSVCGIDLNSPANVVVGRDTRPSGVALVQSLNDGIKALEGELSDYRILTTPQLHYITRCLNTINTPESYGEPTKQGYFEKMVTSFNIIVVYKEI